MNNLLYGHELPDETLLCVKCGQHFTASSAPAGKRELCAKCLSDEAAEYAYLKSLEEHHEPIESAEF